jgi:hypothetical protein
LPYQIGSLHPLHPTPQGCDFLPKQILPVSLQEGRISMKLEVKVFCIQYNLVIKTNVLKLDNVSL